MYLYLNMAVTYVDWYIVIGGLQGDQSFVRFQTKQVFTYRDCILENPVYITAVKKYFVFACYVDLDIRLII